MEKMYELMEKSLELEKQLVSFSSDLVWNSPIQKKSRQKKSIWQIPC